MSARFESYPNYRPTGIQLIEFLPEHWGIKRLKFISPNVTVGVVVNPSTYFDDNGEIPFLRGVDVSRDEICTKNVKKISVASNQLNSKSILYKGDLVSIRVGYPGVTAVVPEELEGANCASLLIIRKPNEITSKLLSYQINSDIGRDQIKLLQQGAAQEQINVSDIVNFWVVCPPKSEAKIIEKFINHETAKIDTLIAKQEQLIKLLKEKRQSVISHAVTKGVNPDAPMKDSGVEWLGEVPEAWAIKSYRYACKIYRGKFGHRPRNDPAFYDGEFPFIQTGDVARADKFISSYNQTLNEKGKGVSQLFPAGTLMMAIAANIGDTAILGFEAYAPDSVVGFKPYANLDIEFLRYSFMAALPALEQTSTQSTQANLNVDRIGAVKGTFPPYDEQLEIVNYLDNLLERYDSIEKQCKDAIELMKERRTALISAAVTGKIDVRNWQPTNNKNTEEVEVTA